ARGVLEIVLERVVGVLAVVLLVREIVLVVAAGLLVGGILVLLVEEVLALLDLLDVDLVDLVLVVVLVVIAPAPRPHEPDRLARRGRTGGDRRRSAPGLRLRPGRSLVAPRRSHRLLERLVRRLGLGGPAGEDRAARARPEIERAAAELEEEPLL